MGVAARNFPPKTLTRRLLGTARRAAGEVGRFVARQRSAHRQTAVHQKVIGEFVTAVDVAAEARLRRLLLGAHPEHGFVGEETGLHRQGAEFVWVVDPVDGTSNFMRGLYPFGVSVACLHLGQPIVGAVHCEPEGVVYSAALHHGAFRAARRVAVPRPTLDAASIVGVQWLRGPRDLAFLRGLVATGARVRNHGSTVAQLCDVATGRLDANLQEQGKIWDIAAAGLIAAEAGAAFTDWSGRPIFPFASLDGRTDYASLAAAPPVHRRLVAILSRHA